MKAFMIVWVLQPANSAVTCSHCYKQLSTPSLPPTHPPSLPRIYLLAQVREALHFSAKLRLPASVTRAQRMAFVEEVLQLLE